MTGTTSKNPQYNEIAGFFNLFATNALSWILFWHHQE